MASGNMRYPSSYAGNDPTSTYIRNQQNYIQQLQQELDNLRNSKYQMTAPAQPVNQEEAHSPEITAPTRHAEITQVKDKKEVVDAIVDIGTSRMFMSEDEETIWIKSVDKDGRAILHNYPHGEDEDITTANDYVTKDDLKSMLTEAVGEFSKLIPPSDAFVRKDEIKDIIVETLSSNRRSKKEEE